MQLSIRGVDEKLSKALKDRAEREDTSVNRLVLRLLGEGCRLVPRKDSDAKNHALDEFFGIWSEEEAREFDRAVARFDEIDEEMWR